MCADSPGKASGSIRAPASISRMRVRKRAAAITGETSRTADSASHNVCSRTHCATRHNSASNPAAFSILAVISFTLSSSSTSTSSLRPTTYPINSRFPNGARTQSPTATLIPSGTQYVNGCDRCGAPACTTTCAKRGQGRGEASNSNKAAGAPETDIGNIILASHFTPACLPRENRARKICPPPDIARARPLRIQNSMQVVAGLHRAFNLILHSTEASPVLFQYQYSKFA